MQLRIGQKVFAPSVLATVLTLLLLPVFISLGCWQLRRADEKRDLMRQAALGQAQLIELNSSNVSKLPRYQHVKVEGVFDSQHQVLLDNMPSSRGEPGYRVWTPLRMNDGVVIVDRGWIAHASGRADQSASVLELGEKIRVVTGLLDELPRPGIRAGNAGIGGTWPEILNYPKFDEMETLYGSSLVPRIILLDSNNPDGFDRHWQIKQGFTPERHIAYAVQWFGFAITLVVIFIVVNLKREIS
jgi:surfeit locus 1 family protein